MRYNERPEKELVFDPCKKFKKIVGKFYPFIITHTGVINSLFLIKYIPIHTELLPTLFI